MSARHHTMLVTLGLVAGFTFGCNGESSPENNDCGAMPVGLQRDMCFAEQIKATPATGGDAVMAAAQQITDPMVKGAAISGWVEKNVCGLTPKQGESVCGLLEGRDESYCMRRLSSPHLQDECKKGPTKAPK